VDRTEKSVITGKVKLMMYKHYPNVHGLQMLYQLLVEHHSNLEVSCHKMPAKGEHNLELYMKIGFLLIT